MKRGKKRVLVVEPSRALSTAFCNSLEKAGYTPVLVESGAEALECAQSGAEAFDVILLDMNLPDMSGDHAVRRLADCRETGDAHPAVVIMTDQGAAGQAMGAVSYGAADVILKPFDEETLRRTMKRALAHEARGAEQDGGDDPAIVQDGTVPPDGPMDMHGVPHGYGFIGDSAPMQAIYRAISQVARSSATVFITGESGTGKELCAHAIHRQSARRDKPFKTVHCAAVPRDHLKSEIFGHVDGACSAATGARTGAAELAEGGTLFLDEIMEMDLAMQSKLLRFVQTHAYTPVGGSETRQADIRIICTTNRDPLTELREGRLREDLFYRLYVIPIHMPPLYARGEDVCQIARAMLKGYAVEEGKTFDGFDDEVEELFQRSRWPGNIRQLQNVIRHIVVLNNGGRVTRAMLPHDYMNQWGRKAGEGPGGAPGSGPAGNLRAEDQIRPLWLCEKDAIENAIRLCGGNIPRAARRLEVSPSTIYRKRQGWENAAHAAGDKKGKGRS